MMRIVRANVLDVVNADYITTARAKGLKERDVIIKHLLRNALIPILTSIGTSLATSIGGSMVLEKIFSFPGLGLYISDAIAGRDYPIVRGCAVFISAFTALVMLLVDLSYAYVDPRVKAQFINSARIKGKIHV
jgi:peptide/nickel transport system permease protein